MFYVVKFVSYTIGIDFAALKIKKNSFGSGVITNVSGMGV